MTKREAVVDALNHIEREIVPYHAEFTAQALENLAAFTGDANIEANIGSYLNYQQYWGWPTELPDKPGHFRDEFGVIWNRTGADRDIGVVENPQISDIEDHDYRFPRFDVARLRDDYRRLIESAGGRFTFAGFGFCMFERSWSLMGMENVLMSMVTSPSALHRLYGEICDYYLPMLDIALEYDIDGVYFGDDWGQQRGLIMGPKLWRTFIKPHMARLYERVKRRGKFVLQHSCGDCREILPDLIDIGLDCYQTFQPEIYDIAAIKLEFGKDLAFWGGVSTQQCLPVCTPDEVKKETARVMAAMRSGGGYIAAPIP